MIYEKQRELIELGGAFIRCGKVFCIVHGNVEIDEDGDCPECHRVDCIIGSEYAEARAMQRSQDILENDDYFEKAFIEY